MTDSAVTSERQYNSLLARFVQIQGVIDCANLSRYHQIGGIFNEFCEGLDRQLYGSRTVQRLADDLRDRGVLSDISDPVRYLYWARSVYNFDPSFDQLQELSKHGFTVSHAKLIFSLQDDIRDKVLKAMLETERVPSTRDLQTQLRLEDTAAASQEAMTLASAPPAETPTLPPGPAPVPAPADGVKDEAEKSGKEKDAPEKVEKAAKADKEAAPVSPLKTINGLEKLVSKVVLGLPDAFIAIRHVEKTGFDSDKAQANYKTALSNLRSAVKAAMEPLKEFKKLLDECTDD